MTHEQAQLRSRFITDLYSDVGLLDRLPLFVRRVVDEIASTQRLARVDTEELGAAIGDWLLPGASRDGTARIEAGRSVIYLLLAMAMASGRRIGDRAKSEAKMIRETAGRLLKDPDDQIPWSAGHPPRLPETVHIEAGDAAEIHAILAQAIEDIWRGRGDVRACLQAAIGEAIDLGLDGAGITGRGGHMVGAAVWLLVDVVPNSLHHRAPHRAFDELLNSSA